MIDLNGLSETIIDLEDAIAQVLEKPCQLKFTMVKRSFRSEPALRIFASWYGDNDKKLSYYFEYAKTSLENNPYSKRIVDEIAVQIKNADDAHNDESVKEIL